MDDSSEAQSLEERRLALEERKLRQDYETKMIELDLKRAESGWFARLFTPLTTTVFAGILTLAASAIGAFIQGRNTLVLEREKFEANRSMEMQKQQHELILKMVSVGDEKQAKANLKFLAESGLLSSGLAASISASKDVPVLPTNSTSDSNIRVLSATERQALLGGADFSVTDPDRGTIQVDDSWVSQNIVSVNVPQLRGKGSIGNGESFSGQVRFHKAAAPALLAAFAEVEQLGLIDDVKTFDASFAPRLIRGSLSTLSPHALGIAFDINASNNPVGTTAQPAGAPGSVLRLVPVFERHGFVWGGRGSRPDPMHFEFADRGKLVLH